MSSTINSVYKRISGTKVIAKQLTTARQTADLRRGVDVGRELLPVERKLRTFLLEGNRARVGGYALIGPPSTILDGDEELVAHQLCEKKGDLYLAHLCEGEGYLVNVNKWTPGFGCVTCEKSQKFMVSMGKWKKRNANRG